MRSLDTFYKLLSYLYPIKIKKYQSEISGELDLTWFDGKLMLNSKTANYSYGNLQLLLDLGISKIDRDRFFKFKEILVLGVAGGSVIETLYEKYLYKHNVDAVEIDSQIIEISKQHFNIDKFKNCNFIIANAQDYVQKCSKKYNFIIIDLFIDYQIPKFVLSKSFLHSIKLILDGNGIILLNTIELDFENVNIYDILIENFEKDYFIEILKIRNHENILYLIYKL